MKKYLLAVLFCAFLGMAAPLQAQTRNGEFQVSTGGGIGAKTPVRFDLDIAGEYFWNDKWSLGLDFDVFLRGSTSFDVIPFGRYHFDLPRFTRFSPYVGAGLGVLVSTSGRGWIDLMLPETGFLWEFTPNFYFGPNVSLHTLGGSATTWDLQLVGQAAYRF